jgi:pimeloyl-ACP methyl ester carboxylesterase
MTLSLGLFLIGILGLSCLSTSIFNQQNQALAQQYIPTIKYRNLVIDLGNGLKTNAQLTLPSTGKGPFPGILLVPGSGIIDMNETLGFIRIDNQTHTKIYPPARPYFQIAQYLSERGFVVLKYNKRGLGENNTILDSNVWGNLTSNDLKHDAEKALDVLIQQPEVAANRITVVGHSEGTTIAPRIAIDKPDKVQNIVLMGAIAQNLSKLAEYQAVGKPLLYAKEVLDHNHDGLFSLQEANKDPIFRTWFGNLTLFLRQNITNTASKTTTNASTSSLSQQLNPKYNTNNGAYVDIDKELKPKLLANHESHSVVKSGK